MQVHYKPLTNTEKYFLIILLIGYLALVVTALLIIGNHNIPCRLLVDSDCGMKNYFFRLMPFYTIGLSLNISIVLSAYYLNKLAKKSIYFLRALILPPLILMICYMSQYGNELLRAFT